MLGLRRQAAIATGSLTRRASCFSSLGVELRDGGGSLSLSLVLSFFPRGRAAFGPLARVSSPCAWVAPLDRDLATSTDADLLRFARSISVARMRARVPLAPIAGAEPAAHTVSLSRILQAKMQRFGLFEWKNE